MSSENLNTGGWDLLEDEPMPPREASKWDILKKVPFAGAIYSHSVEKKELARQAAWRSEQAKKREASLAALNAERERYERESAERQRAMEAEQAQRRKAREDEQFLQAMSDWRANHSSAASAKNERRQEIAERAFNDILTPVELIVAEAESVPEVTASTTEYEGKEIPVYTLHGRELKCFVHAINFKGKGDSGDANRIGASTAVRLQNDPSFWDKGRDEVVARSQDSDETHDNPSSVSSSLSATFFDTARNFQQVGHGGEVWDYGFSHLAPGSIVRISSGDGGFVQGKSARQLPPDLSDNFLTPDEVSSSISTVYHNEFYLNRYDEDGKPMRPDFMLTSSSDGSVIPEIVKKHAAYFGVPIFSIDQSSYREKERARVGELIDSLSGDQSYEEMIDALDSIDDSYVANWPTAKVDTAIGRADRDWILSHQINLPSAVSSERRQELVDMELAKKLDFIKRRLSAATAAVKEATAAGRAYDSYHSDVPKVEHCDAVFSLASSGQVPDLPKEPAPGHQAIINDYRHRLDIELKLGGRTRQYAIHDGKHPATEGYLGATGPDVPDYYAEFAPLVDAYLAALKENDQKAP